MCVIFFYFFQNNLSIPIIFLFIPINIFFIQLNQTIYFLQQRKSYKMTSTLTLYHMYKKITPKILINILLLLQINCIFADKLKNKDIFRHIPVPENILISIIAV